MALPAQALPNRRSADFWQYLLRVAPAVDDTEAPQRVDQEQREQEEHLAQLLGDPSEISKEPEPSLELEDQTGDFPDDPRGEFLQLMSPVIADEEPEPRMTQPRMPVAAGLD